jgi:hypothetical protein
MSAFAPTRAALEGWRLIRREPAAAMVWIALWLGAFLLTAFLVATGAPVAAVGQGGYRTLQDIADRFGPLAAVSIPMFLLVWATTTVAVYRAVLRPHERRFFFLRLGVDEGRLAVMTVSSFILVLLFGGAPAYLVLVLADPLMRALPDMARDIATLGAVATVMVEIWLGVRLSLISVETFAERRFHLTAYWPLARGRFWYLLGCYFFCFLIMFGLSIAYFVVASIVWWMANPELGAGDLVRRTSLLGLAGVLATLTAAFSMLTLTIFCGCQAFAFRAIVSEGKADVVIV